MAQLSFFVGKTGRKSVKLVAELPALSKLDPDAEIPFEITLPDGRVVRGKADSKKELAIAQLRIQLQHATRDILFPNPGATSNGTRDSDYVEE